MFERLTDLRNRKHYMDTAFGWLLLSSAESNLYFDQLNKISDEALPIKDQMDKMIAKTLKVQGQYYFGKLWSRTTVDIIMRISACYELALP